MKTTVISRSNPYMYQNVEILMVRQNVIQPSSFTSRYFCFDNINDWKSSDTNFLSETKYKQNVLNQ